MKCIALALIAILSSAPAFAQEGGLVTRPSKYSVTETAERLDAAIKGSGGYKLFFRLDHAANAAQATGVTIKPSQLFLFGNPVAGTPLLQASPTMGMDLPLRALIWEDANGKVWMTYNDFRSLLTRHGIKRTDEQIKTAEERQASVFDKAVD